MRPPDPAFADPRLARLYDLLDHDRSDLDPYVDLVLALAAKNVVDDATVLDSMQLPADLALMTGVSSAALPGGARARSCRAAHAPQDG